MSKDLTHIPLEWKIIKEENPDLESWLEESIEKKGPDECWTYIR